MSRRVLLWLVPLFITLHNLEELWTMPGFLAGLPARIPAWAQRLLPAEIFPPTARQFALMILMVTLVPYLFALLGGARRARSPRTLLLAGVQIVMLINVVSHVVLMNIQNGYVPGLVTTLLFNLPFSLLFLWSGLRQGWLRSGDFAYLVPFALLLHGLGLFGLTLLAARLIAYI